MQHDDRYAFGGRGGQGPNLVVSIRESLLEDSRIVSALGRSAGEASPEFLPIDTVELRDDQDAAGVVELSPIASEPVKVGFRSEAPNQNAKHLHGDVEEEPVAHGSTTGKRSLLGRLLPSLIPGIVSLGSIAAVFTLLTIDGRWNDGILGGWAAPNTLSIENLKKPVSDEHSNSLPPAVMQPTIAGSDTAMTSPAAAGPPLDMSAGLAATRSLLDQVSVRQDKMASNLDSLQASTIALGQMISTLSTRPAANDEDLKKLLSQNDQMARDIAALQVEQQTLSQRIANISRPRPHPKVLRPN
jgi:hypothetical protein